VHFNDTPALERLSEVLFRLLLGIYFLDGIQFFVKVGTFSYIEHQLVTGLRVPAASSVITLSSQPTAEKERRDKSKRGRERTDDDTAERRARRFFSIHSSLAIE
jgi:hypothetical protein